MKGSRLRVVETAQGVAGAACGRLFAGLGHDVVKCEPAAGDPLRRQPPLDETNLSWTFRSLSASKRSLIIDSDRHEDNALFDRLLHSADVLITDLDPDKPRKSHPHLVVTSITGFGLANEMSNQPDDSLLAEAYGGLATMIGDANARPLGLGGDQVAYAAAFAGFLGTMVALAQRDQTGTGDLVDVAMCDVAAYIDWKTDIAYAISGNAPCRRGSKTGRWRMVPAADGWIGVIYQPEQWPAVRQLVGDPRLEDPRLDTESGRDELAAMWWPIVEEWARQRSRREAYEQAQAAGLPFGYAATVADVADSTHYTARGFIPRKLRPKAPPVGPLVRSKKLTWKAGRSPKLDAARDDLVSELHAACNDGHGTLSPFTCVDGPPSQHSRAPLAGVVVLDLGTITAGAAAARILGDYGATVIKVESPDHPDPFRRWNPPGESPSLTADSHGASAVFESNNVGKLGVALDLKTPEGRDAFYELARHADVLVENFRVGVTARLGVDFESLCDVNPRLVYLSLSSQGQDGPEAGNASLGSTLDLISGLASITGYSRSELVWSSEQVNYPDQVVSILGAGLVAYCLRQGIGGAHLDVAQAEVVTWTLAAPLGDYRATRRLAVADGNHRPGCAPRDTYPTSRPDHWVALVCLTDLQRRRLADLVGIGGADGGEEWWTNHRAEVDNAVTAWTSQRTRNDCVEQLNARGVPAAPVFDAADRKADPRFTQRRVFLNEPVRLKGYPFVLESFAPAPSRRAPRLGADTTAILSMQTARSRNLVEPAVIGRS